MVVFGEPVATWRVAEGALLGSRTPLETEKSMAISDKRARLEEVRDSWPPVEVSSFVLVRNALFEMDALCPLLSGLIVRRTGPYCWRGATFPGAPRLAGPIFKREK